jgi:uncharacterized protein YjdB
MANCNFMKNNYIYSLIAIMLLLVCQISGQTTTNYLLNSGFELDNAAVQKPQGWSEWTPNSTDANAAVVNGDAHSGNFYGKMSGTAAYNVMTFQTLRNLPAGIYSLKGWFRSSGGQGYGNFSIKNHGGAEVNLALNTVMSTWTQKIINNISITSGTCEIDIYSQGAANQWTDYDDIELTLVSVANVPVTDVIVTPTSSSVAMGSTLNLSATVLPADAINKTISWTSSNPNVATVSGGIVSGISPGLVTITATTQDGGKTATSEINVTNPTVINGDFESGIKGWEKSWGNWSIVSDSHSGNSAAMIPLANWGNGLVQHFNVDPQSVYILKFWAKVSSKATDIPVYLSIKNSKGQSVGIDPNYTVKVNSKTWAQYSIRFQTIELMDSVDLWIGDSKTDTLYVDDFVVNNTTFVKNGGFENAKVGWEKSIGTFTLVNDVHSGSAAAMFGLNNWHNLLIQRFDVEELSTYELKFWAKVTESSKKVDIKLGLKNSGGKNVGPDPNFSIPVTSKVWKQYSYKFNTLATVSAIEFWIGDGTTDYIYIDDIELVPASIITNGGFENGKTGWEKSSGSFDLVSPGQSGDFAAKLTLSNSKNVIVQRINVDPITSYELKLWAKVSGESTVTINLSEKNSLGKVVGADPNEQISVSTNEWKSYSLNFSTLSNVDSLDLWIEDNVTDILYFDNLTIRPLVYTSVTGIALDSTSLQLKINDTYKLKATITPLLATNREVTWTSSNPLIATVDINGTVSAIKEGNVTITSTATDGKLSAVCTVKVVSSTSVVNQVFNKIKVYPNLILNGVLKIWYSGEDVYSINITSMNGQSMYTDILHSGNGTINTSFLKSGMYLVHIKSGSEQHVEKVFILNK